MDQVGAFNLAAPFKNSNSIMKRYSKTFPPHFSMSSPAANADPPVYGLTELVEGGGGGERKEFWKRACSDKVIDD